MKDLVEEFKHNGESLRHRIAVVLVWTGWLGSLGGVIFRVVEHNPSTAPWVGVVVVFLIGIAIAASAALGRMRLQDTITKVFTAGQRAGTWTTDERKPDYKPGDETGTWESRDTEHL